MSLAALLSRSYNKVMNAELGHFALILAFVLSIVTAIVPLIGAQQRWHGCMAVAEPGAVLQFFLTGVAFLALTYAFVVYDFTLRLVVFNSHSL